MKKIKVIVNSDDSHTDVVGKVRRALLNSRQVDDAKAFDADVMLAFDSTSGYNVNTIAQEYVTLEIVETVAPDSK